MSKIKREPLAIVGVGCRYPGNANSPEEFWKLICDKKDALTEIPEDRWDSASLFAPEFKRSGKINVKRGGFIKDIDKFDADFFGISSQEAKRMDPQQRMLLEVSYEAVEDAGLRLNDLDGSKTAVFIGVSAHDYSDIQNSPSERLNIGEHTKAGSSLGITANRISYSYNLKGPSVAIDTAGSSALNAVHMACRSIWEGDANLAFAGGVNSILKPETQMGFSKGGFLSPDGICYSFDERGNGFIRSEGAGLILIKSLAKAQEDGDNIYAVIRGTAANQDGATSGISVSNEEAQKELLESAYKDAGVDPHDVQFVEGHGAGNLIGDEAEASAIGKVIGTDRKDVCYIGSVKSNIGHLESASGIAGITKMALALKYGAIPPNIHFENGLANVAFDDLKLEVPTSEIKWPGAEGKPRFGGVSSFGLGGSNAHVVLESPPAITDKSDSKGETEKGRKIFVLSAGTNDALRILAENYIEFLKNADTKASFNEICATAALRRTHHGIRLSVIASSKPELAKFLSDWLNGDSLVEVSEGKINGEKSKIAFVFSGQGPQWFAMGRELLKSDEGFKATIMKIDKLLSKHADWSLFKELSKPENQSRIAETNVAQPLLFAVQVALYEKWKAIGVEPDAVLGHSIGEIGAAYASGAITLEQAVKVVYHRSRLQSEIAGTGKMLAVALTLEEAQELIQGKESKVAIGAVNAPAMLTLSGNADTIVEIAKDLKERNIFNRMLVANVPFHSHHMQPLRTELISSLGEFEAEDTKIPFYSTVFKKVFDGYKLTPQYWFKNMRDSVFFTDTVQKLIDDGFHTFVELGPHPVLANGMNELLAKAKVNGTVLGSMRRKEDEERTFLAAIGSVHCAGFNVDWKTLHTASSTMISLPKYPWQRKSYWIESEAGKETRLGAISAHPHLVGKTVSAREKNNILWEVSLDKRNYPYIENYKVQGPIIFPAAGHIDLMIGAAKASFGNDFAFIEDVNFDAPLILAEAGEAPHIQIDISHDSGDYFIYSKSRSKDAAWRATTSGKINHIGDRFQSIPVDLEKLKKRINVSVDVDSMHAELLKGGLLLGESFKGIKNLYCTEGKWESLSEIEVPESIIAEFDQFNIHPGVLDSCFQTFFGIFNEHTDANKKMGVYLPSQIGKVKWHGEVNSNQLFVHSRFREWSDEYTLGELWIFNADGSLIAEFHGFKSQYLKGSRGETGTEKDKWFYEYNWNLKMRAEDEINRNPGVYLNAPSSIKKDVDETIKEVKSRDLQSEFYKNYEPELSKLALGYICSSLKEMGMSFDKGAVLDVKALAKEFKIVKEQSKLFAHMFLLLSKAGILKKTKTEYEIVKSIDFKNLNNKITDLKEEYPEFHHESNLLESCGSQITSVLQGKVDATQLIYPDNQWDKVVQYYNDGFLSKKYNDIAARCFTELISKIPEDQPIRILEVGAGTGGVSQAIIPMLPVNRTEYMFTDLLAKFGMKAQQRFANYPFVQYNVLDIEKDVAEQGFVKNSYDIIIASGAIHTTRNVKESLGNVHDLLASEGVLMMIETTNSPVYLDLIFGMTAGRWLFEDDKLRKEQAILAPTKWKQVLEKLNYSDFTCYTDFDKNDKPCQAVILAKAQKLKAETIVTAGKLAKKETNWLIFADKGGTSETIIKKLTSQNKKCVIVRRGEKSDEIYKGIFEINATDQAGVNKMIELITRKEDFEGVVFAWGLDAIANSKLNAETIAESEESTSIMMMNIMRKLSTMTYKNNPSIWTLLSGTQSINNSPELVNLSQQGLRGVGRVIVNEFPLFKSTLVDFSSPIQDVEIDEFLKEINAEDNVDELAFRANQRFVLKLDRLTLDTIAQESVKVIPAEGSAYNASMLEYGDLDNLILRRTERKVPETDEVEITVKASALNARDLMIAKGQISDEAVEGGLCGKMFGIECAGIVSKVGKKVKHIKVGDEVMATAPSCFSGFAYPKAAHVVLKPKKISWAEATSLPIVYATAYFSLVHHCRIQKGDKVLIHAAAGGVGIAAVHIAKAMGAEIYATCSSPEKASYLKKIGVKADHVLNSRTLEFSDEIMRLTKGEGVDIVLNSLSREAVHKSLQCLSAYGRFVEIGKTDIYRNSKLGLQPFGNNLSYFGVDIDRLFKQKIEFGGKLLQESIDFFVKNKFPAHPVTAFPINKMSDAFELMESAKHIGKVVISMEGEVEVAPAEQIVFNKNGTYLLTVGTSSFGLFVADWMTTRGCKNLVLVSEDGVVSEEEKAALLLLKAQGVKVLLEKGNIAKKEDVDRILKGIKKNMPPLKGVQHMVMANYNASIVDIDNEKYMDAFKPKAVGCWLLHEATKKMDLDHFVLHSSVGAIYGNPGRVSNAGANSFVDNFSSWRRGQNLPSTTINWGAINEFEITGESESASGLLKTQGWKTFNFDEAIWVLEQMLLNNAVQRVATDTDWETLGKFYTHSVKSSRIEHLIREKALGQSSAVEGRDNALEASSDANTASKELGKDQQLQNRVMV
ncbi:MAG: acyltransferase domain-containing protein [Flavobacteriales bacterium]|nr:acyltransferase domain-containing protein [Flavobacteriales bacterium]